VLKITSGLVTKRLGSFKVLRSPNLQIKEGKYTLRILRVLVNTSDGDIYFDKHPIGTLEPKERDIEMVSQDYALYA
jgi:ABC-type sugar transport system ATPase subunit